MKRMFSFTLGVCLLLAGSTLALAQSSGNFTAAISPLECEMNNSTGVLKGTPISALRTTIKTPNSQYTTLLIRPSLVTGLFTNTKITNLSPTATAVAGVKVRVLLDGAVVAPGSGAGWVYYDKRFQQLSSNLFSNVLACADPTAAVCNIDLTLSTLSAHSLDFVAGNVGGGVHELRVEWTFDTSGTPSGSAAACVGPAVYTVQQVKAFSQSGGITVQ